MSSALRVMKNGAISDAKTKLLAEEKCLSLLEKEEEEDKQLTFYSPPPDSNIKFSDVYTIPEIW